MGNNRILAFLCICRQIENFPPELTHSEIITNAFRGTSFERDESNAQIWWKRLEKGNLKA